MKFRQFEFRLFPKIRNRKKKKNRLGYADYPRDISQDRSGTLYQSRFPCFYDNLAAEADNSVRYQSEDEDLCYDKSITEEATDIYYSSFKTFPLSELSINIDDTYYCACASDIVTTNHTHCRHSSIATSVGTPNTVPRTRTRIKTNPWLPSPRSSPSPSPTDQRDALQYLADDTFGSRKQLLRPNYLPLSETIPIYRSVDKNRRKPVNRLPSKDITKKCQDSVGNKQSANKKILSAIEEVQSPLDHVEEKVLDYSYETDISSNSSPVVEFLKYVKYEIDFSYEHAADNLLENVSLPRDDSFHSVLENDSETSSFVHDKEPNENVKEMKPSSETLKILDGLDDSPSNMQESIDTGYASVSNDSDGMSESEYAEELNIDQTCQNQTNIDNNNKTRKHEKSESEESSVTRSAYHFMEDTPDDLDNSSEIDHAIDLEWDEEPITKTLMFQYDSVNEHTETQLVGNIDQNQAFERYGSFRRSNRYYKDSNCACRRRSRSLADIELSLDEKVTLLREEKSFVQSKIREAVVEERVRDHQLKVFRLLSGDKKKEVILKTLYDLKSRLEDQSERLQASYSTVLSLRNMFAKRHLN